MNVFINQLPHQLADGATLAAALALLQPRPPFAIAVNQQFVPNTHYADTTLQPDDRVEIIAPITGG